MPAVAGRLLARTNSRAAAAAAQPHTTRARGALLRPPAARRLLLLPLARMGMAASAPVGAGVCAASAAPLSSAAAASAGGASAAAIDAPLPPTLVLRDRAAGALWAALAADALAMPVHWYYNPADVQRAFPGGVGGRFPYGENCDEGDENGGEGGKGGGGGGGGATQSPSYYSAPPSRHPSSIMQLHSTGGQGRGGQSGSVIGDVINHGKKQYWGVPGMHYHNCLKAGDNTLNALCLRLTARAVAAEAAAGAAYGGGDGSGRDAAAQEAQRRHAARFLKDYVSFMTTPGSHDDTYAESFHRAWFANYARGVAPERCSKGTRGHDDSQVGGFFGLAPVATATAAGAARAALSSSLPPARARQGAERAAADACVAHLRLTHDSPKLEPAAARYGALMARVLLAPAPPGAAADGDDDGALAAASAAATALLKSEAAREALEGVPEAGIRPLDVAELAALADQTEQGGGGGAAWDDVRVIHRVTGPACYIESSWPAVLYLSARHADPLAPRRGLKRGLEANANAGGENCHRGAALGALLGCAAGERTGVPRAMREGRGGLRAGAEIRREVDAFLDAAIGKAA